MQDVEEILDVYLRMEERAAGTIPRMLREFGATFPFIVYNRMTPEIAEGLLNGKYDIGFCSDLLKSEDLEYYPILESYIAAVVPKGASVRNRRRHFSSFGKMPQNAKILSNEIDDAKAPF